MNSLYPTTLSLFVLPPKTKVVEVLQEEPISFISSDNSGESFPILYETEIRRIIQTLERALDNNHQIKLECYGTKGHGLLEIVIKQISLETKENPDYKLIIELNKKREEYNQILENFNIS